MLDKGMIHPPGMMSGTVLRFHHTTQNGVQFKTHELFTYGIFNLIFSDHNPWVTETLESEPTDKGGSL